MCSYVSDDLKEIERIDLGWLEGNIYVVLFYEFGGDSRIDLRVIFVKVCEGFDWCAQKKIKFNWWKYRMI